MAVQNAIPAVNAHSFIVRHSESTDFNEIVGKMQEIIPSVTGFVIG